MAAAKNVGKWYKGSRGERKYSIAPGDARTFVNPTCSPSARSVKLHSNYVCDFVLFCLVAVVSRCFLPVIYRGESGMGPAPVLFLFYFFGS